ncbi:hypothetical protein B0H12DRAFT_1126581, partial [Mycena haematopus]
MGPGRRRRRRRKAGSREGTSPTSLSLPVIYPLGHYVRRCIDPSLTFAYIFSPSLSLPISLHLSPSFLYQVILRLTI